MLGPRSNPVKRATPRASAQFFAHTALLALNPSEQPGNEVLEQGPPPPQMPPVAVFPQEENYLMPVYFAADTAFDCEDGDGAASWASFAD